MASDDPKAVAAAFAQFEAADNMTDRMAALNVLSHSNAPERDSALAAFHARFAGDALVIDKWFSVQALSTRTDTPAAVAALMQHRDFSTANPNRLRSLVGAYAANQVRFHVADGAGYRLVTDAVLAVDSLNPQAAARLVSPLGRWQRFDAARAALMRAELERIVATPGLSKDVFEIASKSLV
jgi:aminopeptidase N